MKKRNRLILLTLFIVSLSLRLWKLGEIPQGLSLNEVGFGLSLSKYVGSWILNPVFIRLPFVILGIASIYLVFLLIQKITDDFQLGFVSSFLLAITPWHIAQSRVYSPGMGVFFLVLLVPLFILRKRKFDLNKLVKFSVIVFLLTFIFSVFSIDPDIKYKVDEQRNIASMSEFNFLSRIFSNKIIESYRYRRKLLFENFDLGNYFFSGHPTERWGVEEIPKLFVIFLPLMFAGMLTVSKKTKIIKQLIIIWIFLSLSVFILFELRGPGETLPIVFPLIALVGLGLNHFSKKKGWFYKLTFLVVAFELMIFCAHYFSGLNESQFSPRCSVFENLVQEVESNLKEGERVVVSQRLKNPKPFFQFYLNNIKLDDYEFRTFNIWDEEAGKFFVDVLPDGALPNETLYTDDGSWPGKLEFVGEHYDTQKRQTVFIYRKNI